MSEGRNVEMLAVRVDEEKTLSVFEEIYIDFAGVGYPEREELCELAVWTFSHTLHTTQ